jgi:hypothetical protein
MKTKIIIKDYLKNINLSEFGSYSNDPFFNGITTPFIPNVLNSLNSKYSGYTQFPVINKMLKFRKIQNMLGDGLCGYYVILSQLYEGYSGDTLGPDINNEEINMKARNDALTIKESIVKKF